MQTHCIEWLKLRKWIFLEFQVVTTTVYLLKLYLDCLAFKLEWAIYLITSFQGVPLMCRML